MYIRKATSDDSNSIINLYSQLLPNDSYSNIDVKRFLEIVYYDTNYNVFILEVDNRIVSTCTLVIIKNLTHGNKPYGIIENVITDEKSRGKGYGSFLLKYAINIARERKCHKIMIQTQRKEEYVIKFYIKCGFSKDLCTGLINKLE